MRRKETGFKKHKKPKIINLMKLPRDERALILKEMRRILDEKVRAAKIWKTLLYYDNLTINGYVVYSRNQELN